MTSVNEIREQLDLPPWADALWADEPEPVIFTNEGPAPFSMTSDIIRKMQPAPTPNDSPDIQSMVIEDMTKRREFGYVKYNTYLQAGNGRDALRDAYEEALDLATYLRQAIEERDKS